MSVFCLWIDSTLNHLGNPRRRTPSEELTRPYHFVYLHVRSLGVDKFNDDFSQFLRLAKMNTWFGFVIIWIFHLLSTEQRHLLCSLCVNKQTNFDSSTFADFTGKKKKMATGTFTQNTESTKSLTTLMKTYRKALKPSNLTYTMSLTRGQILQKYLSELCTACMVSW